MGDRESILRTVGELPDAKLKARGLKKFGTNVLAKRWDCGPTGTRYIHTIQQGHSDLLQRAKHVRLIGRKPPCTKVAHMAPFADHNCPSNTSFYDILFGRYLIPSMAYAKINASLAAKKQRIVVPRFARTHEWQMMKADIDKGLKAQDVLQLSLTDEDKTEYGLKSRRTIARFVRKYLRSKNLSYVVRSFRRDSKDYVLIQNATSRR